MTSPSMTAADVLREARRLVKQLRFAQGDAVFSPGCTCSSLAIQAVTRDFELGRLATRIVKQAAGAQSTLSDWHDQPGRTKDEILAAFDRAIALAESSPGDQP